MRLELPEIAVSDFDSERNLKRGDPNLKETDLDDRCSCLDRVVLRPTPLMIDGGGSTIVYSYCDRCDESRKLGGSLVTANVFVV